jgi:hypothetical protein
MVGGGMYPKYGPQINVNRGPKLVSSGDPSALATGLVAIVDAITISANILAAMHPDKVDPFVIAAKAIESATMAVLCGIEATLAWLHQAEIHTKQLESHAELYARSIVFYDEKIKLLRDEVIAFAFDGEKNFILTALKAGDAGFLVHDCKNYVLAAKDKALLTVFGDRGSMTMQAMKMEMSAKQLAVTGEEIIQWGTKELTIESPKVVLKGRKDRASSSFTVTDQSITAKIPDGAEMDLTKERIFLKLGVATFTMDKSGFILKVGEFTQLGMDADGIYLEGKKISLDADLKLVLRSQGIVKQDIAGVVEVKGTVQKNN